MKHAVMYFRAAEQFEQGFVEGANLRICWLFRAMAQVHGRVSLPPFHLPFLQKAQTRNEEGDDCGRTMHFEGEGGSGAGFVVILEETRRVVLILGVRFKVLADG